MKQEDALITEFAAILEAETEVLVGPGDIDALHDITERKSGIAHKLVELSQTRDALLAEIGLPAGHAGTEQAAAQHPQLAGVWQALLSKSESANEINLRNGALIDVHLRYTQQSLDALRGLGGGPASTSTYDAQGRGTRSAGPQAHRRRLNAGSDAPLPFPCLIANGAPQPPSAISSIAYIFRSATGSMRPVSLTRSTPATPDKGP